MSIDPIPYLQNKNICQATMAFGVTVKTPQNNIVQAGEIFTKMWKVMNLGNKPWKNRVLVCQQNNIAPSLRVPQRKILVPDTPVGGTAIISLIFKAPDYPCTAVSEWQFADKSLCNSFNSKVLHCSITVLSAPLLVG